MTRRVLQTLFVTATALLLTTTACDKGDGAKKADDKKADDKKAGADAGAEAGADAGAEAGADAGGETGAGETGAGETGAGETGAGETGAGETGAGETGEAAADEGGDEGDDGGDDKKPEPKSDGGDKTAAGPKIDGKPLYEKKCKSCHGLDGKGDTTIGKKVDIPSLSKTKLSKAKVVASITDGVADTKMKSFKDKLSKDEIDAVAAYVKKL